MVVNITTSIALAPARFFGCAFLAVATFALSNPYSHPTTGNKRLKLSALAIALRHSHSTCRILDCCGARILAGCQISPRRAYLFHPLSRKPREPTPGCRDQQPLPLDVTSTPSTPTAYHSHARRIKRLNRRSNLCSPGAHNPHTHNHRANSSGHLPTILGARRLGACWLNGDGHDDLVAFNHLTRSGPRRRLFRRHRRGSQRCTARVATSPSKHTKHATTTSAGRDCIIPDTASLYGDVGAARCCDPSLRRVIHAAIRTRNTKTITRSYSAPSKPPNPSAQPSSLCAPSSTT